MSLVSRKWRNFWKNLQVFDFSDKSSYILSPPMTTREQFLLFTVFVNAVLALRRSLVVRKFRLDCYHSQPDTFSTYSIEKWISTAIGPHLEEFHLKLLTVGFNNLPLKLFSCSNLVSLRQHFISSSFLYFII
ncbi:F-box/RNI/FBD-like domain protein [Trifolium medium]|uniref:F-box/RNI/FBD-like domain protein n=1 Tax=Trifolium medium TaxID=97028 RepID=A0A392PCW1_9FABA|nr:F-box/RNI/FBD-like domain protein [Trifolium medium]